MNRTLTFLFDVGGDELVKEPEVLGAERQQNVVVKVGLELEFDHVLKRVEVFLNLLSLWSTGFGKLVLTVLDGRVEEDLQARQMENLLPLGLVVDLGLFGGVAENQRVLVRRESRKVSQASRVNGAVSVLEPVVYRLAPDGRVG